MSKANLLKNSTLLQLYGRAEAPNRDYYGLTIAESCVCLNIWRVTRGPNAFPKQKCADMEDFKNDKYLQDDVKNVFGKNVYQYIMDLSNKKRKLENVPPKVFLNIIKYLSIRDVISLFRVSKIFYELCNTEEVWKALFEKALKRPPSSEEKRMAFDYGWKEALKRRLVFVKKAFVPKGTKILPTVAPKLPIKSIKKPAILLKKPIVRAK